MNPTRDHGPAGSIPGLDQWVNDLAVSCGVGSCVAVVVAYTGSCSSNSAPSLGNLHVP